MSEAAVQYIPGSHVGPRRSARARSAAALAPLPTAEPVAASLSPDRKVIHIHLRDGSTILITLGMALHAGDLFCAGNRAQRALSAILEHLPADGGPLRDQLEEARAELAKTLDATTADLT